ncbi:MAG: hypothetical protein ACP5O3_02160 [Candidatus Micrarchaeia archaeon]
MVELVTEKEERVLLKQLIESYEKIYETTFLVEEKNLSPAEVGEVQYTYAGEENEVTAQAKMNEIRRAIKYGYCTPVILLKSGSNHFLVDGHRRLRVAWENGLSWKALVVVPSKPVKFGVEKMALGKIKDLY